MGTTPSSAGGVLRFGVFEIDRASGELRRNGSVVRLAPQPFQVLRLLAENAGEVVERDRLRREVWGETVVDFDRSLNVCIAQVRGALNDDADSPRFIQTLARRGYRFLAAVERPGEAPGTGAPTLAPPRNRSRAGVAIACAAAAGALALGGYWLSLEPAAPVRVAVLPFDTVAVEEGATARIEGLFDELLTRLGGIEPERMRVIGRRSAAQFRGERARLTEIGQRLRARYLLEGTVRGDAGAMRVTVRLVEAATETMLWSESFAQEGEASVLEDQVVARVSAGVLSKLFPGTRAAGAAASACKEGWEAYRTGRMLANRGTIVDLENSVSRLEKAGCAAGHAALADVWSRLARLRPSRTEAWERARTAAWRALAGGEFAAARLALANAAMWKDWDWAAAERAYRAALRLNPSDPDAHHDSAWLPMALGRKREAVAALERSIALDPLSARTQVHGGWLYLHAERFGEAAAQARRALELEPGMEEARACLSRALLYAGDERGALEAILPLIPEERRPGIAKLRPSEAIRALFEKSMPVKGADPYQRAWRLAWLGARQEALAELEEAHRTRSASMPLVAVDPAFASLRREPRFRTITRAMGL